MIENRTSTVADRAIAGGVVGIILAIVGFYRVTWAAPPLGGSGLLEVVFKALLGMLIGYALGILSGLYFARHWPTRQWSPPILYTMGSYAVAVFVIILSTGTELTISVQLWLYALIPPTALALALRQIGYRASHLEASLMGNHNARMAKMGTPSMHRRTLRATLLVVAFLLPFLGAFAGYLHCASLYPTAYGDILFGSYVVGIVVVGFVGGVIAGGILAMFVAIGSHLYDPP